ncbi:hypothetical protein [Trebonia kvetii]|uniref:hypothetical protein n=1 Tax=Trebonia kvetii TaxID=2480626 RepID=UPI001651DBC7|nr:hypothetical protein [Trebonia kvetii]
MTLAYLCEGSYQESRTVFGRQEPWRVDGRPLAQWDVTDEPVAQAGAAIPR